MARLATYGCIIVVYIIGGRSCGCYVHNSRDGSEILLCAIE